MSIQDELNKIVFERMQTSSENAEEDLKEENNSDNVFNNAVKYCPQCQKTLPIRAFISPRSGRMRGYCLPCSQKYQRDYTYGYYDEKPTQCEICGILFDLDTIPRLDHNHKTGIIRGWLCHSCNLIIGHAKEDLQRLEKAIEYLKKHNKEKL